MNIDKYLDNPTLNIQRLDDIKYLLHYAFFELKSKFNISKHLYYENVCGKYTYDETNLISWLDFNDNVIRSFPMFKMNYAEILFIMAHELQHAEDYHNNILYCSVNYYYPNKKYDMFYKGKTYTYTNNFKQSNKNYFNRPWEVSANTKAFSITSEYSPVVYLLPKMNEEYAKKINKDNKNWIIAKRNERAIF